MMGGLFRILFLSGIGRAPAALRGAFAATDSFCLWDLTPSAQVTDAS
jgi:hypothetical protein